MVGEATGTSLEALGHAVAYEDTDESRLAELRERGRAIWTAREWREPDLVFICVETPSVGGSADLSRLRAGCSGLGEILRGATGYPVVVLKSTVPPGTTEELAIPWLEGTSGRTAGVDFGVCYNPEFLRRFAAAADALNPWIIVIGRDDARAERLLLAALDPLIRRGPSPVPVCLTDYKSAEMAKYASNLFNATKISFTNEIWLACRDLGIDGDRVMAIVSTAAEGMWNPGYGIKGGYPYSGGCLPKDAVAFLGFARARSLDLSLLEAVVRVNAKMATLSPPPLHQS